MTNVEVAESLKYGFKLFVYLLGVAVLGGGGMALGGALAGPELLDGSVTDNLSSPELLGGVVLAVLGLGVWFTGTFGLLYKLLADAVRRGVSTGTEPAPARAQEVSEQPPPRTTEPPAEPVGRSPGEQAARQFGPGPTVPGAADVPDRGSPAVSMADNGAQSATTAESQGTSSASESEGVSSQEQPPGDEQPAVDSEPSPTADEGPVDDAATTVQQPDGEPEDDSTTTARRSDDVLADQADPADDQEQGAEPTGRVGAELSDDDEASTIGADDQSAERTAEEIAFGTARDDTDGPSEPTEQEPGTEQGEPASESVGDDEGETPPDEGTIPPYEKMDDAESSEGTEEQDSFPETGSSSETVDSDDRSESASNDVADDTVPSSEEPAPDEGEASDWAEQSSTGGEDSLSTTGDDDPLSSTSGGDSPDDRMFSGEGSGEGASVSEGENDEPIDLFEEGETTEESGDAGAVDVTDDNEDDEAVEDEPDEGTDPLSD